MEPVVPALSIRVPPRRRDQRVRPADPDTAVREPGDGRIAVPRALWERMLPVLAHILAHTPVDDVKIADGKCGTDRRGIGYATRRSLAAAEVNAEAAALGLCTGALVTADGCSRV